MSGVSLGSLPLFQRAVDVLQVERSKAKADPLAALLGLLLCRVNVPALGSGSLAASGDISDLLYDVYGKLPGFEAGLGATAYLDLFSGLQPRGANDWRNAIASQKGLACFGTDAEMQSTAFRFPERSACPHRQFNAIKSDYYCNHQPTSTCRSQKQSAGEVGKLLKAVPINQATYGYQLVSSPSYEDLEKLVPGASKIPIIPVVTAIYAGARDPRIRQPAQVITTNDFLANLGLSAAAAAAIFDMDPATPGNQEFLRMTEPYLLSALRSLLADRGFVISLSDLINFHLSLKTRAFVILSGISGTGKSLLPRLFAEELNRAGAAPGGNLEVVPVRPGWNDLADLMGYYNAIHQGFEPGPAIGAIAKASAAADGHGSLASFLVLDEMNLARVEHYFADFLSVAESRRFDGAAWVTDPLRLASGHTGLMNYAGKSGTTPFVDSIDALLPLPDNLFVVGTINIDESTHGLSSKVLDRANTIEFDKVVLRPGASPTPLAGYQSADIHLLAHALCDRTYRDFAAAHAAYPSEIDDVVDRLIALYKVLEPFRLHFGMRTRDEVASYMAYALDIVTLANANAIQLEGFDADHAFDRQVLQKVLPRVSGTREELQHSGRGNLFDQLTTVLAPLNCPRSVEKIKRMRDQEIVNFWEA